MNYQHTLILYRTITPLHVGCGQAVGVVDLPVIRERATGYPFIPGSGIRGSLRDIFENKDQDLTNTLFGPEADPGADEEDKHAGCVAIHDARLLFYPVRADRKVFLWITCPLVLERFNRDRKAFEISAYANFDRTGLASEVDEKKFIGQADLSNVLHLEEFGFERDTAATAVATNLQTFAGNFNLGIDDLAARTVLVSNRSFYHFVNYATILMQHNTLTSAKTVKDGALFSVESLPPETIFYGMFGATDERKAERKAANAPANGKLPQKKVMDKFKTTLLGGNGATTKYLHLGGKESTGLGLTQLTWVS